MTDYQTGDTVRTKEDGHRALRAVHFNYLISYAFHCVTRGGSGNVNGRRKKNAGVRGEGREAREPTRERGRGRGRDGGARRGLKQDTLPSERWKAFQPESTLAQLCFLFGGGCGVAGKPVCGRMGRKGSRV